MDQQTQKLVLKLTNDLIEAKGKAEILDAANRSWEREPDYDEQPIESLSNAILVVLADDATEDYPVIEHYDEIYDFLQEQGFDNK